jgi:5-methylcytosine-specific restriction endonuclease McrA
VAKDLERQREYARKYREANREMLAAKQKAYAAANAETVRVGLQKYQARNRERLSVYLKEYNKANRKRLAAQKAARYAANREAILERQREYVREHPEVKHASEARRRARRIGSPGPGWTADDVKAQHKAQNGRCFYCKKDLGKKYHRDHIIPLSKGGHHCRSNLALACPPCNMRKHDKDPQEFAGILL